MEQERAVGVEVIDNTGPSIRWLGHDESRNHRGMGERRQIRNALDEARAVVVIWTKAAGESDWVKSEAGRANRARKLAGRQP